MTLSKIIDRLRGRNGDKPELLTPVPAGGNTLCELATALPSFLKWEWDEQMEGALALIEVDAGEQVLSVLNGQFPQCWDRKSLRKAPPTVTDAMKNFGGLRPKQQVFVIALADDLVLLGLWWPWGHGSTISIRLVPYSCNGNEAVLDPCRNKLMRALRLA